jgi:hypothetical protein
MLQVKTGQRSQGQLVGRYGCHHLPAIERQVVGASKSFLPPIAAAHESVCGTQRPSEVAISNVRFQG